MQITEVTRRNIIDYLIMRGYPFYGRLDLIDFLNRIWDLSSMPSTDHRYKTAEGDIRQHMLGFPDWDEGYLLYKFLNILRASDEIFLTLLETCIHPLVLSDEEKVSETLSQFNKYLAADGYRLGIASRISGKPVYKAQKLDVKSEIYDVALSFAGEDREYVEKVAQYLQENEVSVFYDKYEEVDMWGKDLPEHLDEVYRKNSRYCVIFISKYYAEKVYPTHERRSALAKAIQEKDEYLLPARFDDTEVPGIRPTIAYIDLRKKSPEQFAKMILKKLGYEVPKSLLIDKTSLWEYITGSSSIRRVDSAISPAPEGKGKISIDGDFILSLVDRLKEAGFANLDEMDAYLNKSEKKIIEFGQQLLDWDDWFLPAGISLLHMCYVRLGKDKSIEDIAKYLSRFTSNSPKDEYQFAKRIKSMASDKSAKA